MVLEFYITYVSFPTSASTVVVVTLLLELYTKHGADVKLHSI